MNLLSKPTKMYNIITMKINKSFFLLFFVLIANMTAFAQDDFEMADTFRSDGKIYVVIAVLLVIFTGIVAYLVHLDRKLKRLEKNQKDL